MSYIKLLRIHQWAKNLFLFIPLFFAGQVFEYVLYPDLVLGFFAFSLAASAVYVFNDICDRENDRAHPRKKFRPIASGAVPIPAASILMTLLALSGLALAFWLDIRFFGLLLTYLLLNVGYSLGLKNYSIVDIFIVASGFIFRILSGGILSSTPISHWLLIMVLLLSLFLALAKRRDDLLIKNAEGEARRKSLEHYNLEFVNSCLTLFGSVIIVAYILYTVSPEVIERFHTEWLFLTSVFVIAGIVRYLQIVFVEQNSGSPTAILLKDKFIIGTLAGWILSFFVILYLA